MLLTIQHAGLVVYCLSDTVNTGPDARTFVTEAAGVTTHPRVMTTTPSFDDEPSNSAECAYGALGSPTYDKDRRLERLSEPVWHSVRLSPTEHESQSADTSKTTSPKTLSLGLGPVPRRVVKEGAGCGPRYVPELPPSKGERNRRLIEDGCVVAAREERLLDIWCRKLQRSCYR